MYGKLRKCSKNAEKLHQITYLFGGDFLWGLETIWPQYTGGYLTPKKRRLETPELTAVILATVNLEKIEQPQFFSEIEFAWFIAHIFHPHSLIGVARNHQFSGLSSDWTAGNTISLCNFAMVSVHFHTMQGGQSRNISTTVVVFFNHVFFPKRFHTIFKEVLKKNLFRWGSTMRGRGCTVDHVHCAIL